VRRLRAAASSVKQIRVTVVKVSQADRHRGILQVSVA
jgi:hypothetical protein